MTEQFKRVLLQSQFSRTAFGNLQALFYSGVNDDWLATRETFERDGIVILPGFFSRSVCEAAINEIDKAETAYKNGQLGSEINTLEGEKLYASGERVIYGFDFRDTNTAINALVYDKDIQEVCEYLNRSRLKVIQHWAKRVNPAKNVASSLMNEAWHRDGGGLSLMRFIVYLNDIDVAQGPFEFARGSHRSKVSAADCKNGKADIMQCTGKQGDVIVANVTGGWHRATRVTSGQRNTLQVAFSSPMADRINRLFKFGSYLSK